MNFELTEEQTFLREGMRRFIADQYDFQTRRERMASASGTDRQMWAQFAQMGWLGVLVPEDQGGLDWPLATAAIVLEEFGRALVVEPYLDGAWLAVRILSSVSAPVAGALLSRIVTGDSLVGVALTEPGSRYVQDRPKSAAHSAHGGYRLSGRKILVVGGDAADTLIVSAELDGAFGLFEVPVPAAGVERNNYRLLDGSWACDVTFNDVALHAEALLVRDSNALDILDKSRDEAALGAAAEAVGCMDRILEITVEYLGTRKQFGQPLARFQVLQHRVADLFVEVEMARSALYGALSVIDAAPDERGAGVSAARVRIDQAALNVGNQGIHLHGGMGMTMEYPVGHFYRRLIMLTRAYGDTEYHLERYERLSFAHA